METITQASSTSAALATSLVAGILLLSGTVFYSSTIFRWLQRKRYQYEVTFSLYMLTPTEKFIFNSFLFLVLSMIIIAASLYLPSHISMVASRAFYYYAGDVQQSSGLTPSSVSSNTQLDALSTSTQTALPGQQDSWAEGGPELAGR